MYFKCSRRKKLYTPIFCMYKALTENVLCILTNSVQFTSVQSLSHVRLFATHRLQHSRPTYPSPTPGVYPNLSPLSQWCHPTISSSVVPYSSCTQSFPAFWKRGIPDHLTCLLRNLLSGQEATIRTGHGTTVWFRIGKGVHQSCIMSLCLFNLYSEYIMRNAGLEEVQAGIMYLLDHFNWVLSLHRVPKYWSFTFNFSPSN